MWNPVTITALIGAVSAAVVAVVTALRSPTKIAQQVGQAMANHYAVAHQTTTEDDFAKRVNPN